MTPADRRMTELIDKWLASIDLHLAYAELSDAAYARVQPWPKHDRPTKWVLEVARQKIVELKSHCETRQAMGDGRFAESLELMAFLANLVGIQHIQRFIPLADPAHENKAANTDGSTVIRTKHSTPASDDSTREMPKLKPAGAIAPAREESAKSPVKRSTSQTPPARKTEAAEVPTTAEVTPKIIADAVRLLKWGKPWHELAELIARIADRPSTADIRKVLRTHKADIEAKAAKDA